MSSEVADVCLAAEHAVELVELLEFLGDWLDAVGDVLAGALAGFCGAGYPVGDLRADLARFAFVVGGGTEGPLGGGER